MGKNKLTLAALHCSSQTSTLSQALSFSTFIACIFFLIASISLLLEEELRNRLELLGDCRLAFEKELSSLSSQEKNKQG